MVEKNDDCDDFSIRKASRSTVMCASCSSSAVCVRAASVRTTLISVSRSEMRVFALASAPEAAPPPPKKPRKPEFCSSSARSMSVSA